MLLVASGQRGGQTFSDNLLLAIPGFVGGGSAVASSIIGVIAIWHRQERAWSVYIATLIGLSATIFILGEFITPH